MLSEFLLSYQLAHGGTLETGWHMFSHQQVDSSQLDILSGSHRGWPWSHSKIDRGNPWWIDPGFIIGRYLSSSQSDMQLGRAACQQQAKNRICTVCLLFHLGGSSGRYHISRKPLPLGDANINHSIHSIGCLMINPFIDHWYKHIIYCSLVVHWFFLLVMIDGCSISNDVVKTYGFLLVI